MRGVLLSLICAAGILMAAPQSASASVAPHQPAISAMTAPLYALQTADKKLDINITTSSGGGRWYRNPVWIAIMVIGGVVVLMLIVMAARGGGGSGGTTIVK
jgi:hypothetical protein